jgi:hypothetical protein
MSTLVTTPDEKNNLPKDKANNTRPTSILVGWDENEPASPHNWSTSRLQTDLAGRAVGLWVPAPCVESAIFMGTHGSNFFKRRAKLGPTPPKFNG